MFIQGEGERPDDINAKQISFKQVNINLQILIGTGGPAFDVKCAHVNHAPRSF